VQSVKVRTEMVKRFLASPTVPEPQKQEVRSKTIGGDLAYGFPAVPIKVTDIKAKNVIAANLDLLFDTTDIIGLSTVAGAGGYANAQFQDQQHRILINAHGDNGSGMVHEYLHACAPLANDFGLGFDEGLTEFFALDIAKHWNYPYKGFPAYQNWYHTVKVIVDEIGIEAACRMYFREVTKDVLAAAQGITQVMKSTSEQLGQWPSGKVWLTSSQQFEDLIRLTRPAVAAH